MSTMQIQDSQGCREILSWKNQNRRSKVINIGIRPEIHKMLIKHFEMERSQQQSWAVQKIPTILYTELDCGFQSPEDLGKEVTTYITCS